MTGIVKEDMPALGLKKGDRVSVLGTQKRMGRKRIGWTQGGEKKEAVVDAWRVQEVMYEAG